MAIRTENLSIMFTDIKGFTSRTSRQSREDLERLLEVHDELIKPAFEKFGGNIIKTIGDAFLVTFKSPTDAVLCGMEIQNILRHYNNDVEEKIEVRVAINSGEVNIRKGDVFGEPVNIAARIEGITDAGQVYLTEAVYLSMNKNEILTKLVGKRRLKGVPQEVKVYKVVQSWDGWKFLPSSAALKGKVWKFAKYAALVFLFLVIISAITKNGSDTPTGATVNEPGKGDLERWMGDAEQAIQTGDKSMARELLREYEGSEVQDPPAFLHVVVGALYLISGDEYAFVENLEIAVEKGPENKEVWESILKAAKQGVQIDNPDLSIRSRRIAAKARKALN